MSAKAFAGTCALSLAALAARAAEVTVVERGAAAERAIVISAEATPCERYAAEELRDYVERATGVRMPIGMVATNGQKAIYVGEAALGRIGEAGRGLGEDGFRIVEREGDVLIAGSGKRGALYGAYEFLEKFAGVRWYSSWREVVPRLGRLTVPAGVDSRQVPAFAMREPYWHDVLEHPEFAARLRANSRSWRTLEPKYGGHPYRFGRQLGSCHTFDRLVSPDEYFDRHPEYFSFENGKRVKKATQLCLTNPDVLRIVTERVLECIRKDPGAKFYGVSQNDRYHYCQCENCRAVDEEEGSPSGTMIRFVNAVAERVEKEFPDALIETLAYQYTRRPPKKTRVRHNVVPCLCPIECDFSRPLEASRYEQSVTFCRDIAGWAGQTDKLYVWDYGTDYGAYMTPFANVRSYQDNLRFFRRNGVKFLFEQGAYQGRHADFAELKAWLLSKWMWDPEQPAEPLMQDFFRGYYGPAAPFVRAYFDYLHDLQFKMHEEGKSRLGLGGTLTEKPYSEEFFAKARELWRQAIAATAHDRELSYNVRMGAFSVDAARLEWLREKHDKRLWLSERAPDHTYDAEMKELAQSLLARMDEAGNIRLAESKDRHDAMFEGWKTIATRKESAHVRGTAKDEVQDGGLTILRRGKWGDHVDDPKASDGRALRLDGTHHEWCVRFNMKDIGYDADGTYRIRMRARVEKRGEGAAFSAGVYDPAAKKERGHCGYRTDETSDDYRWYDVCKFKPNDSQWFWAAPGVPDPAGRSAVSAVFIDKIEISRVASR